MPGNINLQEIQNTTFLIACENIRFSSLFAAGDVSRGGTSVTQRQKFHADEVIQCLKNKFGSHGVPNINLTNFTCLLVDFNLVNCCVHLPTSSSKNSSASSTPSTNQRFWPVSEQILRHRYGISVAESQTFLRAKLPQRRRARRNGCFRRLHFWEWHILQKILLHFVSQY